MVAKILSYFSLGVSAVMALICTIGFFSEFPAHVGGGVLALFLVCSLILGWLSVGCLRGK